MQADYIVDIFVFGASIIVIFAFAVLYAPEDVGNEIEYDLDDKYKTMVEENTGLTFMRSYNDDIENVNTFKLLSEFYSLESEQTYRHEKSELNDVLMLHANDFVQTYSGSPFSLTNIWMDEMTPNGVYDREPNPNGVVFPVPSSRGVKEVWINSE